MFSLKNIARKGLIYQILFAGVVSTVVQDSPHKIFIGGLPNYLNEDQVCMGASHSIPGTEIPLLKNNIISFLLIFTILSLGIKNKVNKFRSEFYWSMSG